MNPSGVFTVLSAWCCDALLVADAVERGDHVADEAGVLLEDGLDGVGVEVGERLELADLVEVDEVVEDERDVVEGRSVVSHAQTVDQRAHRYAPAP